MNFTVLPTIHGASKKQDRVREQIGRVPRLTRQDPAVHIVGQGGKQIGNWQSKTGIGHLLSRILITLVLIGVLCGCFCGIAFAMYVHIYINPSAQETAVEISKGLGLNLNSFIYAKESDSDEYTLYETIKHHGVDWVRTIGAVKGWLLGGTQYGGSTITQQLIKNITADNDYSVKRKVNEIFRAFALEKEIDDKDRILVMYLNTIYLGYNSYGVQTAAMQYFDKDVSQLDLAESAVLAGLTNNPSIYDVYNHPEKVKERQETILAQMLDQKMISQEEYEAAVAEELNYRPYEEYQQEIKSTYSYFTDEVIKDVINDLMTEKGYSRLVAENMVYSGGLNIYATIDTKVQNALDEVWSSRTSRAISLVLPAAAVKRPAAAASLTRLTHAVSRVPRSSRWRPMVLRWMPVLLRRTPRFTTVRSYRMRKAIRGR